MKRTQVSAEEVPQILAAYAPTACWKVGVFHGSLVYFDMKDCYEYKLRNNSTTLVGTVSLSLWADEWVIYDGDKEIGRADTIERAFAEGDLTDRFQGQELQKIIGSEDRMECWISFSDSLRIHCRYPDSNEETLRCDLFDLRFPDDKFLCFDHAHGFYFGE